MLKNIGRLSMLTLLMANGELVEVVQKLSGRAGAKMKSGLLGHVAPGTRGRLVERVVINPKSSSGKEYWLVRLTETTKGTTLEPNSYTYLYYDPKAPGIEITAPRESNSKAVMALKPQMAILREGSIGADEVASLPQGGLVEIDQSVPEWDQNPDYIPVRFFMNGQLYSGWLSSSDVRLLTDEDYAEEVKRKAPVIEETPEDKASEAPVAQVPSEPKEHASAPIAKGKTNLVIRDGYEEVLDQITYKADGYWTGLKLNTDRCGDYNAEICKAMSALGPRWNKSVDMFWAIKGMMAKESQYDPQAMRLENRDIRLNSTWRKVWTDFSRRYQVDYNSRGKDAMTKAFESSFGLCQVMYAVAYWDHGFRGSVNDLMDPQINLNYALKHFEKQANLALQVRSQQAGKQLPPDGDNLALALALYNGSGSVNRKTGAHSINSSYAPEVLKFKDYFQQNCGMTTWESVCGAR